MIFQRDMVIREIGCIVAHMLDIGFVPCEKHHLLTTGMHGNGRRRGEEFTIGLNSWSHRGQTIYGWSAARCRDVLGPSMALEPRKFRAEFGSDDKLLPYQNALIEAWERARRVF